MAFRYKGLDLKHPYLMKMLKHVPLIFTRPGVAYDKDGNAVDADTGIFEHYVLNDEDEKIVENGIGIYEAHTNILPAETSQSLNGAYTTPALTGTYTFQVEGSGSVVLSGGATGTVSFGNHVTATLSGQTVTLTGTATMIQILNKAYPLPWGLGGVTVPAESLTAPADVLNVGENTSGTIEVEVYDTRVNQIRVLFYHTKSFPSNIIGMYVGYTTGLMYAQSSDNAGNVSSITWLDNNSIGFIKVAMRYDSSSLNFYNNGTEKGTPIPNPKIPSVKNTVIHLGEKQDGTYKLNSILINFTISKSKRSGSDISNRAQKDGFGVDRQVTLVAPLTHDLRAYRVVRC